jgi:glycosyltransferase involved in cell wall biosynthesis
MRALRRIQHVRPNARLLAAGDCEQRDVLHAARELGRRHVASVGQVKPEAMATLYDADRVYLEGRNVGNIPNSIIELLAAGVAVVSTTFSAFRTS